MLSPSMITKVKPDDLAIGFHFLGYLQLWRSAGSGVANHRKSN